MPIYAYRCTCGKTTDVLVRGREPTTCDDVPALMGRCDSPGALTKLLSAPYVGRSGGALAAADRACETVSAGEGCGHCGMTPGSCGMDS